METREITFNLDLSRQSSSSNSAIDGSDPSSSCEVCEEFTFCLASSPEDIHGDVTYTLDSSTGDITTNIDDVTDNTQSDDITNVHSAPGWDGSVDNVTHPRIVPTDEEAFQVSHCTQMGNVPSDISSPVVDDRINNTGSPAASTKGHHISADYIKVKPCTNSSVTETMKDDKKKEGEGLYNTRVLSDMGGG